MVMYLGRFSNIRKMQTEKFNFVPRDMRHNANNAGFNHDIQRAAPHRDHETDIWIMPRISLGFFCFFSLLTRFIQSINPH